VAPKFQPPPQARMKPVNAELQAKFQQGVALHQQGRLVEAESIYEGVLRQMPAHFDALHLLGVMALLGSLIPALRAASIQPVAAMRSGR